MGRGRGGAARVKGGAEGFWGEGVVSRSKQTQNFNKNLRLRSGFS